MKTPAVSPWRVLALGLVALCAACGGGESASDEDPPIPTADAGPDPIPRDSTVPDFSLGLDGPLGTGPELEVALTPLELPATVGMTSAPGRVQVRNFGTSPLTVSAVRIDSPGTPPRFALVDPLADGATIAPGDALAIEVTYTAADDARVTGTLRIVSNDADESEVSIELVGRPPMACADLSPNTVALGTVEVGETTGRFEVDLTNCGEVPFDLTSVRFEGDTGFVATLEDDTAVGPAVLAPGERLPFDVYYLNTDLLPGAMATARLIADTSLGEAMSPDVPVSVRGGAGAGCVVTPEAMRMEFGYLRIGLTRRLSLSFSNLGNDVCTLRSTTVEAVDGPAENRFVLVAPPTVERLAQNESTTVEVDFLPTVVSPGDRAALYIDYRDERAGENRRETIFIFGVGTEALIEVTPGEVGFGAATAVECAGWQRRVTAANANLVPLCVNAWRLEGEDCVGFVPVEVPPQDALDAGCLTLMPREETRWTFQHEPHRLGQFECTLVVESDAMNTPVSRVRLLAEGVDTAATVDNFETPDLGGNDEARFTLSRPAIEDSIRVRVRGEPNDRWRFNEASNQVRWGADVRPQHRDAVQVEFDAVCLPRTE